MAAFNIRYVRSDAAGGGDGTTTANSGANGAWTLAEAVSNCAAGQEIRLLNTGTYTSTAANTTIANNGTAENHILWAGRNISDTAYENAYINKGVYSIIVTSNFLNWHFIDVYSTSTGYSLYANSNIVLYRSKFKNGNTTATTTAANGLRLSNLAHAVECYAESSLESGISSSAAQGAIYAMGRNSVVNCKLVTQNVGLNVIGGANGFIVNGNLIIGNSVGSGIYYLTNVGLGYLHSISHNTIYNFNYGIYFNDLETPANTSAFAITNNLFHSCNSDNPSSTPGYCIYSSDITNKPHNLVKLNKYYNCDDFSNCSSFFYEVENEELSADPFTAAGSDYTLNNNSGGGLSCKEQDAYPAFNLTWDH